MAILVTGAAGFIGFHVVRALKDRGVPIIGVDNLNDYYQVSLKQGRLKALSDVKDFRFEELDIADMAALQKSVAGEKLDAIIHLAAQAGVRYSLENPSTYIQSNLVGHANILELARHSDGLKHLLYASSSSVYGGNKKQPFSELDPVNTPVSLYAATKRADELLSESYAHLYRIPQTGLRFFTVYGPWGRPDMAPWLFTDAILSGRPINVFNHGDMGRDFTYVGDIVDGIVKALDHPPEDPTITNSGDTNIWGSSTPHTVYNIGNNKPERLMDFIKAIESATGTQAEIIFKDMQKGDVKETSADISHIQNAVGFEPTTPMSEGIPKFVDWFRAYHGV
jgi:UDP-glucuronate 4-epimerase